MESPLLKAATEHAALLCCLFLGMTATSAGQAARPPMAEEVFKNVQILKGIPVDEFMDTMGMFSAATSMNCTDCHTSDSTTTWDKFGDDTPSNGPREQ